MKKRIILLFNLVMMLLFSSCTLFESQEPTDIEKEPTLIEIQNEITEVYEEVSKGCVGIYASNSSAGSSGSGVIYKQQNGVYFVVTNSHVVEDMDEFRIYRGGSKYYRATLLGNDVTNDVAVLTFSLDLLGGNDVYIHDIFNYENENVKIGQTVMAIGCPLSLDNFNSLSTGTVSKVFKKEIVTNAEINPGNSGGGLFNLSGRLIGLVRAKETYTTATNESGASSTIPVEGFGYAITLDIVKKCIQDIEQTKDVITRPLLGITITAVNRYITADKEIVDSLPNNVDQALYIMEVSDGSAKVAGVRAKDVILSIDGEEIVSLDDIEYALHTKLIGQTLVMKVYRSTTGQIVELTINLK